MVLSEKFSLKKKLNIKHFLTFLPSFPLELFGKYNACKSLWKDFSLCLWKVEESFLDKIWGDFFDVWSGRHSLPLSWKKKKIGAIDTKFIKRMHLVQKTLPYLSIKFHLYLYWFSYLILHVLVNFLIFI